MSAIGDRNLDKGKKARRYNESPGPTANWERADAEQLRATISAVTGTGCAIRLGYSRDGGAYCVGIIGDGDPYTIWAGNSEELDVKLRTLESSFSGPEKPPDAVPARKKPM